MAKNKSGYDIYFDNFEYKGHKEKYFNYEIPFDVFMDGVRKYFDDQLVTLDGTDTAVFNALAEFDGVLDDIADKMEDYFKKICKEDAQEEFKEYVDLYYDEEEEEE